MIKCIAVIPARYGSSRLPGKVLLPLAGKPMIQHVWERVQSCPLVEETLVASDDERVIRAVQAFGGKAVMTSPDHASGTDRIAEAVTGIKCRVVLNVQGDEPLISPRIIAETAAPLLRERSLLMATACAPFRHVRDLFDPNCVKVVVDRLGYAIYFTRLPVPFLRQPNLTYEGYPKYLNRLPRNLRLFHRHLGIYAYRRDFLDTFVALPPSELEQAEKLEQLRAIENGYRIRVVAVDDAAVGVDTEADYLRLRKLLEGRPGRKDGGPGETGGPTE